MIANGRPAGTGRQVSFAVASEIILGPPAIVGNQGVSLGSDTGYTTFGTEETWQGFDQTAEEQGLPFARPIRPPPAT
ncbi:MAG: hypothetical protein ACXW3X_13805, partial [Rhodoplanes sp.]